MQEFRDMGVDNKGDLLSYLDEEGYLDTRHQPNHALAILHVAENFKLRDLYIDAFAHCVGMSEQLYKSPEYSVSSSSHPCPSRPPTPGYLQLGTACADIYGSAHQCRIAEAYPAGQSRSGQSAQPRRCNVG